MTVEKIEFHPKWTHDYQGKMDYDFGLVHLSCRYWPAGGGFSIFHPNSGEWEENEARPKIPPSAKASICIGDLREGPYATLIEADIEGATEAEVKAKVETWAATMMARAHAALYTEFEKG